MPKSDPVKVKQIDIVKNDVEIMKSQIDSLNQGLAALKQEIEKLKSIEKDKINESKGGWFFT
tara:strand:+ start:4081 stop:4266 length:186 start_codon:yes stop_codon:yes gene_type:complete